MSHLRFLSTVGLGAALSGCGTQPLVCTDLLTGLTTTVVNSAGQPLTGLSVTDTVQRTGAVLDVTAGSPTTTLPADGLDALMIFSDAFLQTVRPAGDEVVVAVTAEGRSGSGLYRFGSDGCHVQKLAGPDTLVVS